MKKLSSTVLLKSINDHIFEMIQTDKDFTYKELIKHLGKVGEFYTCVETDKFLSVYNENLNLSADNYFQFTDDAGKVDIKLPIMKSFGEFSMVPEIVVEGDPSLEYEDDYSDRKLDLSEAAGQYSYVMIGVDFVARYLYNTLNYYGSELSNDYYCILPKQYKLLQAMGKSQIKIYPNKIVASSENRVLILEQFKKLLDFNLLDKFFNATSIATVELPELNFKEMKLFLKTDDIKLRIDENSVEVYADGYRREYLAQAVMAPSRSKINCMFYNKDIEHLSGLLKLYSEGPFFYAIKREENQTVLFVGKELNNG